MTGDDFKLPHRCHNCGATYDGGMVTITARYADCSVWKAPCCGTTHDDRPSWGGPAWRRMGYDDVREQRGSGVHMTRNGQVI